MSTKIPNELAPDLVLINGKVLTMDSNDKIAEAIAVNNGRIVMVGTSEDVKALIGDNTKIVDVGGRSVIPGMISTHMHPGIGATRFFEIDCRSPPIKSIKEVLIKIREKAQQTQVGKWILATNYNDKKLVENRHITRWELDEVAPRNPVFLSKETGHLYIVNSMALELAGINKGTPNPPGGKIERDPKTRELTGLLYEAASSLVTKMIPSYSLEEVKAGLKIAFNQFLEWGLTTVHDVAASPIIIRAYQELLAENNLPLRMNFLVSGLTGFDVSLENAVPSLLRLGLQSGFGGYWLKLMGIKLIVDGSGSGGSAAVYTPQHRGTKDLGILVSSPEELRDRVVEAHKAGLRVGIHAIGDRAIDIALDAIEAASKEKPVSDIRHRIEHCSVCTPKQLERIKRLGVVPTSSIGYMWGIGDDYIENFGPERVRWLHPHKSYLDYGIIAGGNADWPVSDGDPFKGIYEAVVRKTSTGQSFDNRESVSVLDAIRIYTLNGAYAGCDENDRGSLEPGKLADIVVLSDNILEVPKEMIKDLKVDMTIIEGKVAYKQAVS